MRYLLYNEFLAPLLSEVSEAGGLSEWADIVSPSTFT